MGKKILIFNIIYYMIILALVLMGRRDPSSSLGYGFFIVGFWVIAAIVLMTFLRSSFIRPKSILQKIGVFTATPYFEYCRGFRNSLL
jgi:uncharacterized membrane protein YobD (UPF0266 family)